MAARAVRGQRLRDGRQNLSSIVWGWGRYEKGTGPTVPVPSSEVGCPCPLG